MTIADNGRMLDITITNTASDARLDVYYSNSLGHHLPGRVFTCAIPVSNENETVQVDNNYYHLYDIDTAIHCLEINELLHITLYCYTILSSDLFMSL